MDVPYGHSQSVMSMDGLTDGRDAGNYASKMPRMMMPTTVRAMAP